MDGLRSQIAANYRVAFPQLLRFSHEIITTFDGQHYIAWIYETSEPSVARIEGQKRDTALTALESLLQVTSKLVLSERAPKNPYIDYFD
jgi:hypothetical protein